MDQWDFKKCRKKLATALVLLQEIRPTLVEGGVNVIVQSRWRELYGALDRVQSLADYRGRGGRKPNTWLNEFIAIVAEGYHRAGGNVSAQPTPSGKLETPFLRVLRVIYQRLPKETQTAGNLNALDARARRIGIPQWRSWTELGGFFG